MWPWLRLGAREPWRSHVRRRSIYIPPPCPGGVSSSSRESRFRLPGTLRTKWPGSRETQAAAADGWESGTDGGMPRSCQKQQIIW